MAAAFDFMNVIGLLSGAGLAVLGVLASRWIRRRPGALAPRDVSERDRRAAEPLAGGADPVALPLALLAWDLAAWNIATTLFRITDEPVWHWLDVSLSPFTPPLVLHLVLAYTGSMRRFQAVSRAAYGLFTLLALSSALAFYAEWARDWVVSGAWSVTFLAGWFPIMLLSLGLMFVALRKSRDVPLAAMRARLIIAALVVAGVLGSTELWDDLVQVPSLGVLGTFVAMLLLTAAILRFDLFVGTTQRTLFVYAATVSVLVVTVLGFVLTAPGLDVLPLFFVVLAIALAVALAVRELVGSSADRAARTRHLASLGRFSAQMAHDLKNPLAAMKGAVQYLEAERAPSDTPSDDAPDMLGIIAQQVARMETIIERYQRLARTEPVAVNIDPQALTREIVHGVTVGSAAAIVVTVAGSAPGPWRGDRDLIASALENLVRNAIEAMPDGGRLTVTAERDGDVLTLDVEDEGGGIDPRYLEHVAEDFFTTKASGSGLGLAFARRVALSHGGALDIRSVLGQGTRVRMTMVELREVPA